MMSVFTILQMQVLSPGNILQHVLYQPMHSVGWAAAYLRTKWRPDPSSHLATIDMGRKVGSCCAPSVGWLGPHLTQCPLGRCLPRYQVASWSIQPFGHNTPNITDRQHCHSIGQTVLQMVSQKFPKRNLLPHTTTTTTTTVLRPSVWDYPSEPVPEETLTPCTSHTASAVQSVRSNNSPQRLTPSNILL